MRKTLAIPWDFALAPGLFWTLLVGELSSALLLVLTDRVPAVLVPALRLFLRF